MGNLSLKRCCNFKVPLKKKGKEDVAPVQEAAEHSDMSHQLEKAVDLVALCCLLTLKVFSYPCDTQLLIELMLWILRKSTSWGFVTQIQTDFRPAK